MEETYGNFLGSSAANLGFGVLLAVIIWLKRRIRVSKCKTNCHWFECESQLAELEHVKKEVSTQRGMLQDVLTMLDALKPATGRPSGFDDIILRTPSMKRSRATSV